jgi:UDP-N-acetylglucosamine 2-epimerase (non-hydrolysing)
MIAFIVGTRPELIKTAPVIHELARRRARLEIVHTGQHYTPELDEIFFRELALPAPWRNLAVGSKDAVAQVAAILNGVADALRALRPRIVLVQGDTNTVLGGALAAHKLGIPVAHLEAGLRSDDWKMPEEGNRVLAGHVAALHFCPTPLQAARLAAEGIRRGVYVVGNTVVDAALMYSRRAAEQSLILRHQELENRPFALLTMHRPSNVDDQERLTALLDSLAAVSRTRALPIVFPVHPRTLDRVQAFGLGSRLAQLRVLPPVGYLDMLALVSHARVVLTDSGGIQEEACSLRAPCVTLRANTERPETLEVGANVLCAAPTPAEILAAVDRQLSSPRTWENPLGDGNSAQRVADVLLDRGVGYGLAGKY